MRRQMKKNKSLIYSISFKILFFLLILFFVFSCGGDGGGSSDSGTNDGTTAGDTNDDGNTDDTSDSDDTEIGINVLPQLSTSQWSFFQTYNRTTSSVGPPSELSLNIKPTNQISTPVLTTFSANGLVGDSFSRLLVDDTYIFVSHQETGVSYIKITDITNPKGKVFNYTGREGDDALLRFGASDFVKRNSDDKVFVLYGRDIVDLLNNEIVYDNAPDRTNGVCDVQPKSRFVIGNNGDFWIGTATVNNCDGSIDDLGTGDENGLFKISSTFSSRTKILDDPIWSIFKDSANNIWISSSTGIWRSIGGNSPSKVYSSGFYADQIIEFDGEIYAIMKNFFNNSNIDPIEKEFNLFKWNGSTFVLDCNIPVSEHTRGLFSFIYQNELYFRGGDLSKFVVGTPNSISSIDEIGTGMGDSSVISHNEMLISVGGSDGIAIFNFQNSGETIGLTAVNTAEQLISDDIYNLYSDTNHKMYIAPGGASGFNTFENNSFDIHEMNNGDSPVEFFEHNGITYIHNGRNLITVIDEILTSSTYFSSNGDSIYYDSSGYLWSFPDWGASDYGAIGKLDLSSDVISGTKDANDVDVWNTSTSWNLDRGYHFNDVIRIPGTNEVLIGVSDRKIGSTSKIISHTLKYSHTSDSFIKVDFPDTQSEGIIVMDSTGDIIYGASLNKLFRYENGEWTFYSDLILGDIHDIKIAKNYAFIVSGWGTDGGLEVVNLDTKESTLYTTSEIPLPNKQILSIEIQDFGNNNFRLWLGTFSGLGYCDLVL